MSIGNCSAGISAPTVSFLLRAFQAARARQPVLQRQIRRRVASQPVDCGKNANPLAALTFTGQDDSWLWARERRADMPAMNADKDSLAMLFTRSWLT